MSQKTQHIVFFAFLILFTIRCGKKPTHSSYKEYFLLDKVELTDVFFKPKKKATIPFTYNQIYDPFALKTKKPKYSFEKGKFDKIKVVVLDTVETSMNTSLRKSVSSLKKSLPVIIENTSKRKINYLLLHRGCAILIQEVKNKNGEWIPMEHITKEKIGRFYYAIHPKEYVYTKIPIYQGDFKTTFRLKLNLNNSTTIFSNEYNGSIPTWMLK